MWESFAVQKILTFFQQKNNSVFDNLVGIYLMSWRLNDVVRLKMLWTTGPRALKKVFLYYVWLFCFSECSPEVQ